MNILDQDAIRQRVALGFVLALGMAGCRQEAQASATQLRSTIHVDTVEVGEKLMPRLLSATGTLKGQHQTQLAANSSGLVLDTFVERGSSVKKGDILARVDVSSAALVAAEARANLELSRAQRDTAERECERYAKLREHDAVSQLEYDRQKDQCLTAKLSANTVEVHARSASKLVSDGLIRAPFDGVIAERFVDSGQYVRADSPVVSLAQLDPIRLEFTVAEADIPQVREGATLTFTVPAFPDRVNTGTVRFVSGAVREGTRDLVAEAMVSNPDKSLKPGMFATVSLRVTDVSMPVIPKSAVRVTEGRSYVYLVANKRIEQRVVLTGIEQGDDVAVSRGIQPHDRIVAKISDNVSNGQYVD